MLLLVYCDNQAIFIFMKLHEYLLVLGSWMYSTCCGHPAPCVSKMMILLCICTWLGACSNVIMCADGGTARLGMPGAINPPHLKLTIWCTHRERERERESIVNAGMPTVPQHILDRHNHYHVHVLNTTVLASSAWHTYTNCSIKGTYCSYC